MKRYWPLVVTVVVLACSLSVQGWTAANCVGSCIAALWVGLLCRNSAFEDLAGRQR